MARPPPPPNDAPPKPPGDHRAHHRWPPPGEGRAPQRAVVKAIAQEVMMPEGRIPSAQRKRGSVQKDDKKAPMRRLTPTKGRQEHAHAVALCVLVGSWNHRLHPSHLATQSRTKLPTKSRRPCPKRSRRGQPCRQHNRLGQRRIPVHTISIQPGPKDR